MSLKDFFRSSQGMRLTAEQVAAVGNTMVHRAEWVCPCGATLRIRSRDARNEGSSNFELDQDPNSRTFGHSILPAHKLNWNGLAEERGWKTEPTVCPACQAGMSVKEFKASKR